MAKHALVVKAELTAELIDIAEQELEKLQSAVDGLIQPVDITPNITMWVNEEGLLREDLLVNPLATALYAEAYLGITRTIIKGDIVFTGAPDENGNTTSLQQGDIDGLAEVVRLVTESMAS